MNCTVIGVDLAKRVFQLHWIETETGEICRLQIKRNQLVEFFANRKPCVIAMEACGSAHYWGRKFKSLGHEVRLIAAQFVRPFVKSNKTDAVQQGCNPKTALTGEKAAMHNASATKP